MPARPNYILETKKAGGIRLPAFSILVVLRPWTEQGCDGHIKSGIPTRAGSSALLPWPVFCPTSRRRALRGEKRGEEALFEADRHARLSIRKNFWDRVQI